MPSINCNVYWFVGVPDLSWQVYRCGSEAHSSVQKEVARRPSVQCQSRARRFSGNPGSVRLLPHSKLEFAATVQGCKLRTCSYTATALCRISALSARSLPRCGSRSLQNCSSTGYVTTQPGTEMFIDWIRGARRWTPVTSEEPGAGLQ